MLQELNQIGYKLAHYKEQFNVNILDIDVNLCKQHVRPVILNVENIVNCLHTLISVKCRQIFWKVFILQIEVNDMTRVVDGNQVSSLLACYI